MCYIPELEPAKIKTIEPEMLNSFILIILWFMQFKKGILIRVTALNACA